MKKTNLTLLTMIFMIYAWTAAGQVRKERTTFVQLSSDQRIASQSSAELLKAQYLPELDINFELKNSKKEVGLQMEHEHYTSNYKGIPIEFGDYTVHRKEGTPYAVSGTPVEISDLNLDQNITLVEGFEEALHHINAKTYLWQSESADIYYEGYEKPEGELVILPALPGISTEPQLAYKYFIVALDPMSAATFYVSASTGEIIFENSIICHANINASGNAYFNGSVNFQAENNGSVNRLKNTVITANGIQTYRSNGGSTTNISDITSTSTVFADAVGVQGHWSAEQTVDYFINTHNRSSYDGQGSKINIITGIPGYNNAYWTGTTAVFGNGDGSSYDNFASLDIVGHEIAHGVVATSAGLIYSYESGALNESFADIFGESVEYYSNGSSDWLLGEETKIGTGQAFRSMSNPNTFNHPDTYNGTHWVTGPFDNGGVHFNSGVQNHWFYLLANGGTGANDWNQTYNITGIGRAAAEAIAYRNLTVYLTPSSQYIDARAGAIQSAIDLYGLGSAEEIATTNAWYAVGVGTYYNDPNALTCTSFNLTLNITFDDRPDLIAWNLSDNISGGYVAAKFLNDYSLSQANTTITETITIPDGGMYRLNFYDLETDGLCCNGGNGSFSLMDGNTVVLSGSIFDVSENNQFCAISQSGPDRETNRPTVPQNVAVSNITPTTAEVTYSQSTDDTGLNGYYIFYNEEFLLSGTSASLTNLTPNTQYELQVYALDAYNTFSVKGQVVSFTTPNVSDTAPPTTPLNLVASNITDTSYDLAWDAATDNVGVDHYDVYLDGTLHSSTPNTNITFTGLNANTNYQNYVIAVDAAGNQSGASQVLTTTTDMPAPVCASGTLTLSITFDSNPGDIAWEFKDANNQWFAYSNQNDYANQTPGSTLSVTLPNVPSGDYAFVIYDSSGDGICCSSGNGSYTLSDGTNTLASGSIYDFSDVNAICVSQTNGDIIDQIPPTASILSATNPTTTTVDLTWTASIDNNQLFGYAFFLNGTYYGYVDASFSALTLPYLTPNTMYDLFIVSRDVTGNFSAISNTVSFSTTSGTTETILNEGYFETGWDGWIDGGNDCRRMTTQFSFEGNKSVRIRDNSGTSSSMTTNAYDLSSYDSVRVDFQYYAQSMENNEDFWLRIYENGGWTTAKAYVKNQDFFSNGFYSGSVLLSANDYTFDSNNKFRFQCDASGNGDKIYIDAVIITAYGSSTNFTPFTTESYDVNDFLFSGDEGNSISAVQLDKKVISEIIVYPNPASDLVTIKGLEKDLIEKVIVSKVDGSVQKISGQADQINISDLDNGIYIISVEMKDNSIITKRFIKMNQR